MAQVTNGLWVCIPLEYISEFTWVKNYYTLSRLIIIFFPHSLKYYREGAQLPVSTTAGTDLADI